MIGKRVHETPIYNNPKPVNVSLCPIYERDLRIVPVYMSKLMMKYNNPKPVNVSLCPIYEKETCELY